jgi:hypothetical protein
VRGFLAYLRATLPETGVPAHDVVASARRPAPYLLTTEQIQALMESAKYRGEPLSGPMLCATLSL